jgi:hypothetical protein
MPRHPPNALTSRLRTHTTNNNTDVVIDDAEIHSASIIVERIPPYAISPKANLIESDASRIDF